MLVDVAFLLEEHLQRARDFFSRPEERARKDAPSERDVEAIFGYEAVKPGVYWSASHTDSMVEEVLAKDRMHGMGPAWGLEGRQKYGMADNPEQALEHVRPDDFEQPCAIFLHPVFKRGDEAGGWYPQKQGDYIGAKESPSIELDMVVCWRVLPIDPAKYAAALEARQPAAPAP